MSLTFSTLQAQEVLEDIQAKILAAYGHSVESESDQFAPIIDTLVKVYNQTKDQKVNYWIAFVEYRAAILYMNAEKDNRALELLNQGIERLKGLESPTTEDLALQGSILSLSVNFQPEMAAILSAKAGLLYEKAIKLNDQNLRAYLGVGRSDFFKPKEYGGGYKVESYLKEALTKPDASSDEYALPTWGRADAYYYLASFYKRENRLDEAKLFCNKGTKAFPDHYLLRTLKDSLSRF